MAADGYLVSTAPYMASSPATPDCPPAGFVFPVRLVN